MESEPHRFDHIDNAKGLALLLVISWHCFFNIFPHPVFTEWVLPYFFIVMGLFYKHNLPFKKLIFKKANGLLIPWAILSVPAILLAVIGVKGFELRKCINPYLCIGPSWFLICMFWSYLIYWCLNELVCRYVKNIVKNYCC